MQETAGDQSIQTFPAPDAGGGSGKYLPLIPTDAPLGGELERPFPPCGGPLEILLMGLEGSEALQVIPFALVEPDAAALVTLIEFAAFRAPDADCREWPPAARAGAVGARQ